MQASQPVTQKGQRAAGHSGEGEWVGGGPERNAHLTYPSASTGKPRTHVPWSSCIMR